MNTTTSSMTHSTGFGKENEGRIKSKEPMARSQPLHRVALGDKPLPENNQTLSGVDALRKHAPRVQIFHDDSVDQRALKAQRTHSQPMHRFAATGTAAASYSKSFSHPPNPVPQAQAVAHPVKPLEAEDDHTDDDLQCDKENHLQGFEHITQYDSYTDPAPNTEVETPKANRTESAVEPTADPDEFEPLEPKWNRAIFTELQEVVKLFSRDTLDEQDEDTHDVTMVAEYAPEIFNYMHELEIKLCPDARYMDHQDELQWGMRGVLIDWIVQVHGRFNLLPETLFLTINYMDRFLSKRKVSLSRFQLVGIVALFIAAKYEEINCPLIHEIAYMVDNSYTVDDLLKAERFMIDVLEFEMGWPGPMSFLRRTSKADDYDYETRTLAKYFLEITIMEPRLVACQPSWLAAGSHYLSRRLLNRGSWTQAHVYYSGYTESQLRPLAQLLLESCRHAEVNHKAIYNKYLERRYRRSAAFVQEYFQAVDEEEEESDY